MRRFDFNDLSLIRLADAAPPPADWAYAFPADRAGADDPARRRWAPDGRFHTAFTVHAIVRGNDVALVDLGIGPEASPYFSGLAGRLDQELAQAGLTPAMVGDVMLTHLHLDHVGWASRDGRATFANARYSAPAAELAHWRAAGAAAALPHHVAAFDRSIAPLLMDGLLDGREDGVLAASPGLRYRSVPGHTPGHAVVVREKAGETLVVAGDAWHSPVQIERPELCHRADRAPAQAVRSRIALARFAVERRAIVAAGHFPDDVGIGRIVEAEGGYRWEPIG
jgi:glyoxylase-like metal-dependent hydrolase (beta-lactamase superfamily II)